MDLTDQRQVITVVEIRENRADIKVLYHDRGKQSSPIRDFFAALVRPAYGGVLAYAALAILLVFVPYAVYRERSLANLNDHLQANIVRYEKQLEDLRQQGEQSDKTRHALQSELADLQRDRLLPQIAPAHTQVVPTAVRDPLTPSPAIPLAVTFTNATKVQSLTFIFTAQDYKTYQVEIYDHAGRSRLWASAAQPVIVYDRATDDAMFTLTLTRGFLPPGRYKLRLYRRSPAHASLAEYALTIISD